jgi:ABC-type transport system involved in cytochrome bd biosynthesis fused ATPase/permease subunit
LILLDESTSSVDPATELRVYDKLFAEFPDACIIASLHRTNFLHRFDRVVRMKDGQIESIQRSDEQPARPAA